VFQVDKTQVKLPASSRENRTEVIKESAFVIIQEDGVIKASDGIEDSQLVNKEDISVHASSWMQKNPNKPVVIKADERVKYAVVDDVLEQIRDAGVTNLKFLTNQGDN